MTRTHHFTTHDRTPLGRAIVNALDHRFADMFGNVSADIALADWRLVKAYIREEA